MSTLAAGPLPLCGVLLLALILRVWGLTWGLPSATHYFSYHPDESVVLEAAMGMNVFAGRLLPHFYHYGSLQLYLVNFANSLAFLFGAADIVPKPLPVWHDQWARLYLIGRLLTVTMGVGTVWATFALGARLWGRRAGLLGALVLAVTPLHAQQSHWLTVDVPAAFWGTLALVWAAKLAAGDARPVRAAFWAGVFAGLAAATKYNMALALLPVVVACLLARRPQVALIGALGFALAFLLACPGALLETPVFLRDVRFEAVHVQNADDPTFRGTGNGFVYTVARNLAAGLGLPLLILSLAAVVYALWRRTRGDGLLAAFALPYFVLTGLATVRYARYDIPLLPVLALWTGQLLADWTRAPRPAVKWLGRLASTAALAWTLGNSVALLWPMTQPDNRDSALGWLNANAPSPTLIAFATQPWFDAPPVSPYFCAPRPGAWRELTPPEAGKRIVYNGTDWDIGIVERTRPSFVVLTEYGYRDALRLRDPAAQAYLATLNRDYFRPARQFPMQFGIYLGVPPFDMRSKAPFFLSEHDLPHDMLYPNPAITIFQRRNL